MLHYWISYAKYLSDIKLNESFPWHISSLGFSLNTNRLPSDNLQERKIQFKIDPFTKCQTHTVKKHTLLQYIPALKWHSLRNTSVQLHRYSIRMKSNEDNKTGISYILVRNKFLCLKQVYCCLTFVCMYIYWSNVLSYHFIILHTAMIKS